MRALLILLFSVASSLSPATAQTLSLTDISDKSWASFICANLSRERRSISYDPKISLESDQLFQIGFDLASDFFNRKGDEELDLGSIDLPGMIFLTVKEGSVDFRVGQVWYAASLKAIALLTNAEDKGQERSSAAKQVFADRGCRFIK